MSAITDKIKKLISDWQATRRARTNHNNRQILHDSFRLEAREGQVYITHNGEAIATFTSQAQLSEALSALETARATSYRYRGLQ